MAAKPPPFSSRRFINPIRFQHSKQIEAAFYEEWKNNPPQIEPLALDLAKIPFVHRGLFRVLHRQFSELWAPGLATGVSVARQVGRQWKKLKNKKKR